MPAKMILSKFRMSDSSDAFVVALTAPMVRAIPNGYFRMGRVKSGNEMSGGRHPSDGSINVKQHVIHAMVHTSSLLMTCLLAAGT